MNRLEQLTAVAHTMNDLDEKLYAEWKQWAGIRTLGYDVQEAAERLDGGPIQTEPMLVTVGESGASRLFPMSEEDARAFGKRVAATFADFLHPKPGQTTIQQRSIPGMDKFIVELKVTADGDVVAGLCQPLKIGGRIVTAEKIPDFDERVHCAVAMTVEQAIRIAQLPVGCSL